MNNEKLYQLLKDGKLEDLKLALEENIRDDIENGKGTNKKDITIIKSLIKNCDNDRLKYAHGFTYNNNKYFGFTEGHRVLASKNDFSIEHSENPLKLESFFNSFDDCKNTFEADIKDLKLFISLHKSKNDETPYILNINENLRVGVNPKYLLDSIMFCDTNVLHLTNEKSPIYVMGKENISLVLPVNIILINQNRRIR